MQRLKRIILCLIIIFSFGVANIGSVQAAVIGNDYPYNVAAGVYVADKWNFYQGECVSFCTWRLNNTNGINFHNYYGGIKWGNANNWDDRARSLGITVDNNPAVGSIAQTDEGSMGHVAWVADVNGNNVTIEEYNYGIVKIGSEYHGSHKYNTRTVNKTSFRYIHFKDLIGSTPNVSVSFSDWSSPKGYTFIKDTNASIGQKVNVSSGNWTRVGIYLYTSNGVLLKYHFQSPSSGYSEYYFDINKELGVTLSPGTKYLYRFFAMVDGKEYLSVEKSFTTTGTKYYNFSIDSDSKTVKSWTQRNDTMISVDTSTIKKSGYTLKGFYAYRVTDQKYYALKGSDGAWLTEREISSMGYKKRLYNNKLTDLTISAPAGWETLYAKSTTPTFKFIAVWEKGTCSHTYTKKVSTTASKITKVATTKYQCTKCKGYKTVNGKTLTTKTLYKGQSYNENVKGTWKSSNTTVVTVSSTGKIVAKKSGTATITATVSGKKYTCKVTVKNPSLTVKSSVSVKKGKTVTLDAKTSPSATIKYSSSSKKIAIVSSKGVIKGIKKGTATITVKANGLTKKVKVTIK